MVLIDIDVPERENHQKDIISSRVQSTDDDNVLGLSRRRQAIHIPLNQCYEEKFESRVSDIAVVISENDIL